jgi:hypothetical protein
VAEGLRPSALTAAAAEIERLRCAGKSGFNDAVQAFYAPFDDLPQRLRDHERGAIEPALMFLEADPWCFRSGYMKADLMRALASGLDLDAYRSRIHRVVLHRLRNPEPRLAQPTIRLAAATWGPDLQADLDRCATTANQAVRDSIESLRQGVQHQMATDLGRAPP